MKPRLLLPALLLPFLASCASTTVLNAYVGERSFDDSDIDGVDDQFTFGVEWLWGILPWGLGLEAGVNYSEDDTGENILGQPVDIDATTIEGYVGARKTFREDKMFRPYIAGGLSATMTDFEIDGDGNNIDFDDDDTVAGFYGRVGLGWHFTIINLGVDYKVSLPEDAEFAGEDVDIDNALLSVFAGFSF